MDSISESYNNDFELHITPPATSVIYTNSFDPNKYALLFSGDYTNLRWNDLSHMYSALKLNGFTDENIFVFVPEEANNWNHNLDMDDNEDDFDGYCTFENIENTLSDLSEILTEKDIFFFYCTTHGGYTDSVNGDSYLLLDTSQSAKVLQDDELATMVQDFNCSEMIFVIDACFSGGFVPELEGNHRTVQTCTNKNMVMTIDPLFGYNFLSYAYATALKGYHPYYDPFQPWSINTEDGLIGQQDLGELRPQWDLSNKQDIDPDEVEHYGNNDGFYQTGEAFRYAQYLCGQIANEGQNYQNHGFTEDLLSLYGIVGVVENSQTIDGNYLIGDLLTVKDDVTLIINDNSEIYFNKNYTGVNTPQIFVENDGSLIVGDEVIFWGYDDENQIEIKGSCTLGAHDVFSANEDVRWVGLNLSNIAEDYEIATCTFTNCDVDANCLTLEVSASEFTNSCIDFTEGDLLVHNECTFNNANIIASEPGVNNLISVDNCSFTNIGSPSGSCIGLSYCNSFLISNCTIEHDYHSHGIGIFYSGTVQVHERLVSGNEIYNPPSRTGTSTDGIRLYNSYANIEMNNIHNNGVGIGLLNNSSSYITGRPEFTTEEETQRIKNNVYSQVTAYENCFPTEFIWNSIYKDNLSGVFMTYASSCQQNQFDVENNYWGGLKDLTNHLNPLSCFDYNPIWQMSKLKDEDIAEILYDSTIVLVGAEDFFQAESIMKQIILSYPDSKYALASLKDLFYLKAIYDNDYQGLKSYYDSTAIAVEQPNLAKVSRFFSNQCDVKLENYQNAIDWNNNILLNPDSFEDSIFALIDRDYVYWLMQNDDDKSDLPEIPSFVPKTFDELIMKRDSLLDLLTANTMNFLGIDSPGDNENQNSIECLHPNYPNPFKNQTSFSFTLFKDSDVSLCIYDQLGRMVHSNPVKYYEKGTHTIDFINNKLSPGVYFYKISIDNKPLEARKLMVL